MDLEIIESTFNELMVELSKIKDLNEVAESYKQKTQILSEHLERFLSASENGNNAIMQKTLAIEKALKDINEHMLHDLLNSIGVIIDGMNQKNEEYQKLNAVNLKTITSTLSQIDQNSANFSNKINELKEDNQESRSKLSNLISESVDGLHHKNEILLSSFSNAIKEAQQSISLNIENNENAIRRSYMLSYIQIALMVIIVILFTIGFFVK